ncbi:MAG: hypothetical protein AAGG48_29345 [Planctomycetota bacterium]
MNCKAILGYGEQPEVGAAPMHLLSLAIPANAILLCDVNEVFKVIEAADSRVKR